RTGSKVERDVSAARAARRRTATARDARRAKERSPTSVHQPESAARGPGRRRRRATDLTIRADGLPAAPRGPPGVAPARYGPAAPAPSPYARVPSRRARTP